MGCIEALTTFAALAGPQASTLLNARVHRFANLDDRWLLDTRPMPRFAGESQDRALRRKPAPHGRPQALPGGHAMPRPTPVLAHELGKARFVVAVLCYALTVLAARAQPVLVVNSLGRPVPALHSTVINEFSPVLDKGSVLLIASDGDFDVESARLTAFLTTEFAADAYMALRHLARYGEAETMRLNAAYRDVALLNADWMHHTADMLRAAVSRYSPQRLRDMSIHEVLQAAMGLRDEFAPTLRTIPEIEDSAITFGRIFIGHLRLNDAPAMQGLFGKVWESSVLIHGNLSTLMSMIGCGKCPELACRKYCAEQLWRTRSDPIRTTRRQGGMQQAPSIVSPRGQY